MMSRGTRVQQILMLTGQVADRPVEVLAITGRWSMAQITRPKIASLAIASVLVLPGVLSGCAALPGVSCNFTVDNPHQSSGSSAYMDAKARVTCTGVVQSLTGEIKMERLLGTTWSTVSGTPNSRTITNPVVGAQYTIQTGNKLCAAGTYRAAARGSGVKDGVSSASSAWQYSQTVNVTC